MSELRIQLGVLHRQYRAESYPGDLAADVRRATAPQPHWPGRLAIMAGALAAAAALFIAWDTPQIFPWEQAPGSGAGSVVAVPPMSLPGTPDVPDHFDIVPSFQVFGFTESESPATDSKASKPSTSQESA